MLGERISAKEIHTLDVIFNCTQNSKNTGSEIAKALGITISTCIINIDRLVAKGYVEKVRHDGDKRVSYITLTNEGKAIRQKQLNARKNAIKNAIKNLSQTEKVALINGISKIEFR
jgi:DNA-binding MarR family transcriptional regulator